MVVMGNELAGMFHLSGTWDAIAKVEDACPRLEAEHQVSVICHRTSTEIDTPGLLPYVIEVVSVEKPGLAHELFDFFTRNQMHVLELHSSRQTSSQTGVQMCTLNISIGIPMSLSIAAVRGDFLECCDRLNVDAVMEPVK